MGDRIKLLAKTRVNPCSLTLIYKMLEQPREFVFIILKPATLSNVALSKFIKTELLKYGDIKYLKESITVKKEIISEHYKDSRSSFWHPFVINYLSNKVIQHFILESNPNKYELKEYSFADFLRSQVIGPANLFKTKKNHIRRLALNISSGFLIDNLIHCSANTKEALTEICLWYKNDPTVIKEFETKAQDNANYLNSV